MIDVPIRTAVIVGSVRDGRFADTVARWFLDRARRDQTFDIDVVDLAEADLPPAPTRAPVPQVEALRARLAAAEAFVLMTPEYNHGYPASLKSALDAARDEWMAKPLTFVSYGGMAGGLRAVEQLRQVCAELHMVSTRDCVSLHNCHGLFNEAGRLKDSAGPDAAVTTMLSQLRWWAAALREARASCPYAG